MGKWGEVNYKFLSVSQGVYTLHANMIMFFVLSIFCKLIRLKKLIYILRLNKYFMCKFGFNFSQLYFCFPRVEGQSEIVLGQSGLNQNSQ